MKIEDLNRYALLILMVTFIYIGYQLTEINNVKIEVEKKRISNLDLEQELSKKRIETEKLYIKKLKKDK